MPIYYGNQKIKPNGIKESYYGSQKVYSSSRLPSAYQEVEYIESSGTQYINTGITNLINKKFECEFQLNQLYTTGYGAIFGCYESSERYGCEADTGYIVYTKRYASGGWVQTISNDLNKNKVVFDNINKKFTIDNIQYTVETVKQAATKALTLMAYNSSSIDDILNGKIYYFKVKKFI